MFLETSSQDLSLKSPRSTQGDNMHIQHHCRPLAAHSTSASRMGTSRPVSSPQGSPLPAHCSSAPMHATVPTPCAAALTPHLSPQPLSTPLGSVCSPSRTSPVLIRDEDEVGYFACRRPVQTKWPCPDSRAKKKRWRKYSPQMG